MIKGKNFRKGTGILKIRQCVNFELGLFFQTVYMLNRKGIGKNPCLEHEMQSLV